MKHEFYPKMGGDLVAACERLAKGLGLVGAVIILYRGKKVDAEIGMSFAPNLKVGPNAFRELTNSIINGEYSTSLNTPNGGCMKVAEATDAEGVIFFLVEKDGGVRVSVSKPMLPDVVASFSFGIATNFEARN